MIISVIVCNCAIALGCFWVAWKLWQIRQVLALSARVVTTWERNTHNTLFSAPQAIFTGKVCIQQWRDYYQKLDPYRQQVEQVMALLSFVQIVQRSLRRQRPRQ
jgi:hypothetical protein